MRLLYTLLALVAVPALATAEQNAVARNHQLARILPLVQIESSGQTLFRVKSLGRTEILLSLDFASVNEKTLPNVYTESFVLKLLLASPRMTLAP